MFFFRKKNACPPEPQGPTLEKLAAELAEFKANMTAEVQTLKKNFDTLMRCIEDQAGEPAAEPEPAAATPAEPPQVPPPAVQEEIKNLVRDVREILERTGAMKTEIQRVKEAVVDSKKELRGHMNHMISRLKT